MSADQYPSPKFRHMADEKWHEVLTQDNNGQRASCWEKWLEFSPQCLTLYARWDPGLIVRQHGYKSVNTIFVVEGSMMCGDVLCTKGMHITLYEGTPYGPLVAGPDGVELFEVFMGDPSVWYTDRENFDALLKKNKVTDLPHPPIELPEWMKDTRK